jgi:non-heme chloroperoxidase
LFLAEHGYRAVAHDRRGFGRSTQPWNGYDYDTFADDLAALFQTLDLEYVALFGFCMGGGEVARYIGRHGSAKVSKIGLISTVTPYMLQTPSNSSGTPMRRSTAFVPAFGPTGRNL